MKINYSVPLFAYLLFLVFVTSCSNSNKPKRILLSKKKATLKLADKEYLHLVNGKPAGILRLECKDCALIYTINQKQDSIDVIDGNEDRFIYPKKNTYVKTMLRSRANQIIRVIAFNPNGQIVSNKLDSFNKGDSVKSEYLMKYIKTPQTIIIDRLVKK